MKKISTICSLLLVAATMSAQITFWYSYPIHVMDTVQWITYDSIVKGVRAQYEYNEVDSIKYGFNSYNNTYEIIVLKDGLKYYDPNMVVNDSNAQKTYYYEMGYAIDSIVWHPYDLQNALFPRIDTVPIVTLYGKSDHSYAIPIEPLYATFNPKATSSDESVVQASFEKLSFNDSRYRNRLSLILHTKKEGTATIVVTLDNNFTQQYNIVVTPRPLVSDETTISVDSLYRKIYSRLVVTGNQLPTGDADIKDIDEGYGGFYRGLFSLQELGSDHLFWIWSDAGVAEIRDNKFNTDNTVIYAFFHRLYYNIWLCNSYLSRTEGQDILSIQRAEVRFLRAYFYYYLLDMFGNVPIVTDNKQFTTTPQSSRRQVYQFVESELLAAEIGLASPGYKPDYYRVDKAAAWLLLSRLYLNAPVYYPAITEYDKAAQYAYNVIASSYELASNYKWLFMGDNDQNSQVNDAWKEIIFAIRQEGRATASWGGSIHLVASMSDYTMPSTGITDTWKCYRSRPELVKLFFTKPENAEQGTAEVITQAANDDRALFCNSYNGNTWRCIGGGMADFFASWALQKWTNLYVSNLLGSHPQWPDTDIPLMRKAEAYLNYAEAVLRGANIRGGLSALEAVNIVRRRAHATEKESIALNDILDERGREFYAEGYRRSDLIRFGKFGGTTDYKWEKKGGKSYGVDFPAYMNIYPIPQQLLPAILNGFQNEGY